MRRILGFGSLTTLAFMLVACSENTDANSDNSTDAQAEAYEFAFQNPDLTADARASDLVSRLTLTEKSEQMYYKAPAIARLGIDEYFWLNEALHGVARSGTATVFPQSMGLASTFDEDLMFRIGTAISDEARAKHHEYIRNDVRDDYSGLNFFSPNINIFRDPRWGRGQETYGEDPFLTSRMGVNFISAMQGDDPYYLKTITTAKHYAVHSGPEPSRRIDDYTTDDQQLYETYLPAYKAAVREANVGSIMCAYNAFRGTPACASELLLEDILRDEFGFEGYVVTDCGAAGDLHKKSSHATVKTAAAASALAVNNGVDLSCGDDFDSAFLALPGAVEQGLITEARIDTSITRLMKAKVRLGLFDDASRDPYASIPFNVVGQKAHLELAREAAEKSYVLLKNDGVLPLKSGTKIALIGPNANSENILVGSYNGDPVKLVTPYAALLDRVGEKNFSYSPGASLVADFYNHYEAVPSSALSHLDTSGKETSGLNAEYYTTPKLAGDVAKTQIDANIDYHWQRNPISGKLDGEFSVNWSGLLRVPEDATYKFDHYFDTEVAIDGKPIPKNGIALKAGKTYPLNVKGSIIKYWWNTTVEPRIWFKWVNASRDLKAEALAAAKDADVIIFAGGLASGHRGLEGEEKPAIYPGFDRGDRTSLQLPDSQRNMLKALRKTGKPVVFVNYSGSAIAMGWEDENLNAILQGFYPGEAAGPALANVLFGDVSPSGRLPVTVYSSVKDLPDFRDYSMKNRTYKYFEGKPLYPFGYGLSYADFEYGKAEVTGNPYENHTVTISVPITNTSNTTADEIAQVYIDFNSDVDGVPNLKLIGFKRVTLTAGETQSVKINIAQEHFYYTDVNGKPARPSGEMSLTIGSGQPEFTPEKKISQVTLP